MKKFEFPLASVAKWSQQKLSVEQLALARLVKDIASVEQRLQELREEVAEGQRTLQAQSVLTGSELQAIARFTKKRAEDRAQLQQMRQRLAGKVETQRQRVVAEHRKVKLFSNLYDKRREEWTQALSKEENDLASDLFLAKLARESRQTQIGAQI